MTSPSDPNYAAIGNQSTHLSHPVFSLPVEDALAKIFVFFFFPYICFAF